MKSLVLGVLVDGVDETSGAPSRVGFKSHLDSVIEIVVSGSAAYPHVCDRRWK